MKHDNPDYSKLFKTMPVPRFIVHSQGDDVFVIIEANDLAHKYLNTNGESVNGREINECLDHENAQHFQQSFEVCVSKKIPVTIQTVPGVPGQLRVYGFYIYPVLNEAGEVDFIDVVGQMDVADQSILQRERDDAISLLTSIFDVSEIGIIVTDNDHHIVRVNESFIRTFGWKRDELVNEELTALVTPDERAHVKERYDEYVKNGGHSSGEMKIIRKDGAIANALFTTATMELSQSRRFQITTVMDITLRKQMEQSLRLAKEQADSSNRSKSLFLANMSHELRTPLNAIIGFSEMMIGETFGPLGHDKYKEYLTDVHASAEHLLGIINEVLDMSKIEAGRIELDEENVEIDLLLESVVRMLDSRAFGKNVKLELKCSENMPYMHADPRLLRQILINLIGNAVKFSKSGASVRIDAEAKINGSLVITVSDDGVGIPEDKIEQAMEPFGQVSDRADDAQHQGTGLGLPLAKAMVELHGGKLDIKSVLDEGTDIIISFPPDRIIEKTVS
ncbi:MAG: PAS domain-containing sensor histidine kinase [Micavibrio sp.]|nr:PAS domain-containing sensor histidine kinase [Micavibrio sp.]